MENNKNQIVFNKPYVTGDEPLHISKAVLKGKLSGNGDFTKLCQQFFEERYSIPKCLLTTSGTDALEMAALLLNIQPVDEVIVPSFTFVSTANAFALRGAKIVFADVDENIPNITLVEIEKLVTQKTRAIVVVHYAGFCGEIDHIVKYAKSKGIYIIEDAALAVESKYQNKYLGTFGDLAAFSFHETKNVISGEGGMLAVNNPEFVERAEIIWEKGTNRAAFSRGEVSQYGWKDIGSSYLPSELTAAFLYAQLQHIDDIQEKRLEIWNTYWKRLKPLEEKGLIKLPDYQYQNLPNASVFFFTVEDLETRNMLLKFLNDYGILAVFHYLPLHKSEYFKDKHDGRQLPVSDKFSETIIRLPLFIGLKESEVEYICNCVEDFF